MKPRSILVAGWLGFLLYAYPGYMTFDAATMLVEARNGGFSDAHAPLMTELWRFASIPLAGPVGMLLLQSGLVLFGSYVLLRRVLSNRGAAIASTAILLFPPVMAAMAVIGEDAQLAGFLVGAMALFTFDDRRHLAGGLVLATLACGMREGSALAAFPVVVFGFAWRAQQRPLLRYAIALNAWIVAWLLSMAANYALLENATRSREAFVAMTNFSAMIARSPDMTDAEVRARAPGLRFAPGPELQARARRAQKRFVDLHVGVGRVFDTPQTLEDAEVVIAASSGLRDHDFRGYLAVRLALWKQLLLRPRTPVYAKDNSGDMRIVASHEARPSTIQKLLVKSVRGFAKTPLFSPIVYLVIALAILPLARGRALFLLASGILLMLALSVVTWDAEYRYATWPIVATVLGTVLVVLERRPLRHREE